MENSQSYTLLRPLYFPAKHIPTKRLFDIAFSLLVLTLASPLYLLIILLISFTSKGKIFYKQERIGRGGKPFQCYKFRTMVEDADLHLSQILAIDHDKKKEWETSFKLKDDPRIIFIGKLLRKTSLDELPQFWNVLKGDLSVVGPRPVLKQEIQMFYGPKAYKILQVRPGITGLWQVSGRCDTSYEMRVKMDEEYIEKRTFLFDLLLILKTLPAMCSRRGAY